MRWVMGFRFLAKGNPKYHPRAKCAHFYGHNTKNGKRGQWDCTACLWHGGIFAPIFPRS